MSEPTRRARRAIVFAGGGARGAYEAGVIQYILDELPARLGHQPRFDILCGTSVGAIHACFLAATAHLTANRGARLANVWNSMRVEEVLPLSMKDLLGLPRRLLGLRRTAATLRSGQAPERLYGLLNTEALERLVMRSVPWRSIRRNVKEGVVDAVCVAATQIATGRVTVFVDNRDRSISEWTRDPMLVPRATRLLPAHALASAAIPMLFPAVRIARRYYVDGGLRLNTPLAPAIRLGADRVLVVALRPDIRQFHERALERLRLEDYTSPAFLFGKVLNALLLDHLDTDLARMQLLNEVLSEGERAFGSEFLPRINEVAEQERGRGFRQVQHVVLRPSADLGVMAGRVLENMPVDKSRSPLLRLATRNISTGRSAEADLLSYLLFDGDFVSPLIELGLADARAREDELVEFFSDE